MWCTMWWTAINRYWRRLCTNSFATWQAVYLFPQILKTGFRRDRRNPVFACWGSTPNPLNSPVAGAGCAFGSRTLLSLLRRNKWGLRPLTERGSGSSTTCPCYQIAASRARDCLEQILNVRRIDTAAFIRSPCVLIQIIRTSPEHDGKLAHILQVQPDTDTVQRHLADISAHIQNTGVRHFHFYPFLILRGDANFQFFSPFTHCDIGGKFPCPAYIPYFRYG